MGKSIGTAGLTLTKRFEGCRLTAQLNANRRDALISVAFNCGTDDLETLCKGRCLPRICKAMTLYDKAVGKADGKTLAGLMRRRKAAQDLFNMLSNPEPAPAPDPVPTTEECVAALETENKTLKAQLQLQDQKQTFLEDCILELGDAVFA